MLGCTQGERNMILHGHWCILFYIKYWTLAALMDCQTTSQERYLHIFGLYVAKVTLDQYLHNRGSFCVMSNVPRKLLDFGYCILQSAAHKASLLADDCINMAHFLMRSKELRDSILVESSDQSSQFVIPETYEAVKGEMRSFYFQLPEDSSCLKDSVMSKIMIHGLKVKNLGAIRIPNRLSLEGIAAWVISCTLRSQLELIHFLRTIENLVWGYAADNFSKTLALN